MIRPGQVYVNKEDSSDEVFVVDSLIRGVAGFSVRRGDFLSGDDIAKNYKLKKDVAPVNNFNLSGDEARLLRASILSLVNDQNQKCQALINKLDEISQVQPPQGV